MKKKIIISGHDLGLSSSINAGFEYLLNHSSRLFSEISILPNAPYSQKAAVLAKSSNTPVNLAIALVSSKLTSLTKSPSLTSDGLHLKAVHNVRDWDFSVINDFDPVEIEAEINAQYQWFLDNFGHKPSALVTQKGEHGDPKILEPLIRLAKKEKLPMRAPFWAWKTNYGAQSMVEFEGIKTSGNIYVCFKDWQNWTGYDLEQDLEVLISKIHKDPGVPEVLFLPGFCDQELFDMTSISWQRGQIIDIVKRKYHLIQRLYDEFAVVSYQDL